MDKEREQFMSPHLTPDLVARYRAKALAPHELIAVCDHLDACPSCRRDLEARLLPPLHATYEELTAALDAPPSPETARHLESCPLCRADLDQLRLARESIRTAPRRRAWWPVWGLGLAGAIAAAAILLYNPMPDLRVPAALTELRPQSGVLLGDAGARSFNLLHPVATLVPDDRPVFRWEPLAGATAYRVEVFDPEFTPVASGDVVSPEWTPTQALPRDVILRWRIVAHTPEGDVAAPVPPAPEARFRILNEAAANRWAALRDDYSGRRLAIEAANLGLRQEALRLDPTLDALKW